MANPSETADEQQGELRGKFEAVRRGLPAGGRPGSASWRFDYLASARRNPNLVYAKPVPSRRKRERRYGRCRSASELPKAEASAEPGQRGDPAQPAVAALTPVLPSTLRPKPCLVGSCTRPLLSISPAAEERRAQTAIPAEPGWSAALPRPSLPKRRRRKSRPACLVSVLQLSGVRRQSPAKRRVNQHANHPQRHLSAVESRRPKVGPSRPAR